MENERLTYETINGLTIITDTETNEICLLDTLLDQFEAMQHTMKQLKDFGISQHTALSKFESNTII